MSPSTARSTEPSRRKSNATQLLPPTTPNSCDESHLDLAGMIPTSAEARAFLDDPSAYKRQDLIDRLLAGPEYARRMQDFFDAMLMERRDDTYVPAVEWQDFLRRALADNLPYDQLVTEISRPMGPIPKTAGLPSFTSTVWPIPTC